MSTLTFETARSREDLVKIKVNNLSMIWLHVKRFKLTERAFSNLLSIGVWLPPYWNGRGEMTLFGKPFDIIPNKPRQDSRRFQQWPDRQNTPQR